MRKNEDSFVVQAVWHQASLYSKQEAADWCSSNDFSTDVYRSREEDGEVTHHIHVQFDPSDAIEGSWKTISDDFPEGVSASLCQREDANMDKRYTKGVQSDADPYTFVMSDDSVDRVGDIIKADGWVLKHFRKNPIALWGHSHLKPIGTWSNVKVVGNQLIGKLKLAAEGTSEEIDVIRRLIEQRILKSVSVGFTPLEYERREGDEFGYVFKKCELNECSLVSVPANPNALSFAKGLGASENVLERVFEGYHSEDPSVSASGAPAPAEPPPSTTKTASGLAKPTSTPKTRKRTVKDLATRIAAKRQRLVAIKDEIIGLKAVLDENETLSDDETEMLDTLVDEETSVIKDVETLEKMEQALGSTAKPVTNTVITGGAPAINRKPEKPGSLLVKVATAKLVAYKSGQRFGETLERMYGADDRVKAVAALVMKTGAVPATTTAAGWAAELVSDDLQGFLDELAPISVYANLRQRGLALNFDSSGSITVPRRAGTAGDDVSGSWVGEGGVIPVKQLALTSQTLYRYKSAVISTFTNEIMQQSTPAIETIVRQSMLDDTSVVLDSALLDASALVTGVRPAGLLDGVIPTTSAGDTAADIITDLKVLFQAMSDARVGANPVLIMNSSRLLGLSTVTTAAGGFMFRDELASGTLLGVPVIKSTTVPSDVVYIVDAGSFAAANDIPEFMVSDQTVLTMANADDTAPTQADDGAGELGTAEQVPADAGIPVHTAATTANAGYEAVSMYQTYSTALRMVLPTSWGLVRAGSVAAIDDVSW